MSNVINFRKARLERVRSENLAEEESLECETYVSLLLNQYREEIRSLRRELDQWNIVSFDGDH